MRTLRQPSTGDHVDRDLSTTAAAAPVRRYADTVRAIKALEAAQRELDRTNARELQRLRRAARLQPVAEAHRAEAALFQAWRVRRDALAAEIRGLAAALGDPRVTP